MSINVYGAVYIGSDLNIEYPSNNKTVVHLSGCFPTALAVSTSKTITIKISGIINPSYIGNTEDIAITTRNASGSMIDTSYTGASLNMKSFGSITLNSVSASSYVVDDVSTVTFSMTSNV